MRPRSPPLLLALLALLALFTVWVVVFGLDPGSIPAPAAPPPGPAPPSQESHASRLRRVRRACAEYGPAAAELDAGLNANLMVATKTKLSYCRHGKVGTSTWLHYFLLLARFPEEFRRGYARDDYELHVKVPALFRLEPGLARKSRAEVNEALRDHLKFSFVRHPFERLVSAYEDKILRWNESHGDTYYLIHNDLIKTYGDISFPSFVKYILASLNPEACFPKPGRKPKGRCHVDLHWRPFYLRCAYCDFQYNFIGKMETFDRDVQYILTNRNLKDLTNATTVRRNERKYSQALTTEERISKYFSQLTPDARQSLYNFYKVDFEMFGYSADKYL